MAFRSRRSTQLTLLFPEPRRRGGRRPGAGRKPAGPRRSTPHRARPAHSRSHPVLVTLRALFRPLRSQHVLPTLRLAIAACNRREPRQFRIIGYSTQYDHLHMLVEASGKHTLSAGMRSVAIRIARMVNRLVGRRGRFWADRWHGRALTSPRQVRTAWVYVLANFRKHSRQRLAAGIDPYSSASWFDGWLGGPAAGKAPLGTAARSERAPPLCGLGNEPIQPPVDQSVPVRRPETWLARVGWRRHGLLRLDESPAGTARNV